MVSPATGSRRTALDRGARRIVLVGSGTAAVVVLLLGYRTSTPGGSLPGTAGTAAPVAAAGAGTYLGDSVQTRWGPVQVQVTVSAGKVVGVRAVVVPSANRRDVEINARAVPVLDQEAVQAQSAQIDTVSGATVTSDGYIASLQSALDRAGL